MSDTHKIVFEIKDLNNSFVLVKRYAGKNYFYRNKLKKATSRSVHATLYTNKEEAEKEALEANKDKLKYKVMPASKYFKSIWEVYSGYWRDSIYIRNIPTDINSKTIEKHDEETCKRLQEKIKNNLLDGIKESQIGIESLKRQLEEKEKEIEGTRALINEFEQFNLKEFIDKNTTESERTAAILYGE